MCSHLQEVWRSKIVATSLKASIDPDLIELLVLLGKFPGGTSETVSVTDLTTAHIEEILNALTKKDQQLTTLLLATEVKKQVHFRVKEPDAELHTMAAAASYLAVLR